METKRQNDKLKIASSGRTNGEHLISSALDLQFSTAHAQGTGFTVLTITNPWPGAADNFGWSVAALGSDRLLIGADGDDWGAINAAGAAYLFNTNGMLFATFRNPEPALSARFGFSTAAIGSDQVLVGMYQPLGGAIAPGEVRLFTSSGALLTTFALHAPVTLDRFGSAVTAVGADRVLIGAPWDFTSADTAGAAYLFSTNGTLLTTFTNPASPVGDAFGISVAAVGTDRVLIGAPQDDTGAANAGAAYLFTLAVPTPSLTICLTPTNTVTVTWPSAATGWTLQQNTNGVASVNWSNAPGPIQDDGTIKTLLINPPAENRFYRLFKP